MRISDWSSDVCSSDLRFHRLIALVDLRDWNRDDLVVGVRPVLHPQHPDRPHPDERAGRNRPSGKDEDVERIAILGPGPCNRAIVRGIDDGQRSEEHTSELQSLMRISYAVFCLKKKKTHPKHTDYTHRSTTLTNATNNIQ